MEPYTNLSQIRADVLSGKTTMASVVESYIDRIKKHAHLNAFIEVFEMMALERARTIQEKMRSGTGGKLAGMVMGIKDMISYKGQALSAASKMLSGFTSLYHATVVERLLAADAIVIGRLNCDEFAMGGSNETSWYGPVLNYDDLTKVSGGSSGGSAVAVRAGLCLAALGTDTGGSIRQPASFCDVIGLKPSYGRVSRNGIVAFASSFDQVGPITRSVEDAAHILEVIAGKDPSDATSSSMPVAPYVKDLTLPHPRVKVAYLAECLEHPGLDPEIKQCTLTYLEGLRAVGHQVEKVNFPYLGQVVPAYYILTTAEASSNLARYDGVHYGFRSAAANDLESVYKKSRSEGFGREVKRRILLGTFVLSAGYYEAYYTKAQQIRRLIRDYTFSLLENYDFIVTPTAPTTAFSLGEKMSDPVVMYLADIFTVQASLTGLPAISLPVYKSSRNKMPFGIQVMARNFNESGLLQFSQFTMDSFAEKPPSKQ